MNAKKRIYSAYANSAEPEKRILSPDFKILETFVKVANLRSFRQAAKALKTTQPLVSTRIKQLEEYLRIRLIERDRRLVALTPKGQEFLVHAERLIGVRDDMIDTFRDPATVSGIVRLGVSESIVHTWLPTLMKRVNNAYPNLEFEIEVDISPRLRDGLVRRDLNLAFLLGPVDGPNVYSRPLCSFPVAFVAHEDIEFPVKSIGLEHIAERKIITFARHTLPHMALRELLARSGLRATIWASASLEAVVQMALDGLGIAVIPPAIIEKKVDARERLRRLNTKIKLPNLNYVASWPTAPDASDDTTVRKVVAIAAKVAREWPKIA
ncbi:MAG TPA: LysR family transcriptional regulator [Xanthobacteraceae bacterium]|jgi:DNA-binding transcriptional LysR family regulator|nr:LysR family transcriptional regulator [Xanthobacteraceae bacterium]